METSKYSKRCITFLRQKAHFVETDNDPSLLLYQSQGLIPEFLEVSSCELHLILNL